MLDLLNACSPLSPNPPPRKKKKKHYRYLFKWIFHFLINAWYSNDLEKLELFRAENNSPTDVFYLFRLKDVEIFPEIV